MTCVVFVGLHYRQDQCSDLSAK